MKIEFTLTTGVKLTIDSPEFDSNAFAAQLNNPQTIFMTMGNYGFTKHILQSWQEVAVEEA